MDTQLNQREVANMLISSVIVGRRSFAGGSWRDQYDKDELLDAGLITIEEWVMWDKQGLLPGVPVGVSNG